ncbi:MAG: CCA tRNA nucleotidyltransferase [Kiritimatiellae bacterium]|nr:CCA tRNA nucleotidyltransferase [Kiritimatiellia bacterium]
MFDDSSPLYADALQVIARLRDARHEALLAGGCVRDALLGRALKDMDIATSARPEEIEALFPGRTLAIGKAFGVMLVVMPSGTFDVATFREEGDYRDGRHPGSIRFADARADAQRRDFTINGLFYDTERGTVLDFVGGLRDLEARIVRAIGDPAGRFAEDRLRLLRAVRFAAVLDFDLDPATAAAARAAAPGLGDVSPERIGVEFLRLLLEAPRPSRGLERLHDLDLLGRFLPEVEAMRGVPQPPEFHPEGDVWTHTLMMLDALPPPRDAALACAALLHDAGKPGTTIAQPRPDGSLEIRSPNHASAGAELARQALERLRQPSALIGEVEAMVRRHMTFPELPRMRPAKLRRFMGAPTFERELELHRLDVICSSGDMSVWRFAKAQQAAWAAEPVLPEAWVRGRDLLALGLAPGPRVGRWLTRAYDLQLDGAVADRDALLERLRRELAGDEELSHSP